ncbi:unnamed protein product [Cyclocybe aegerita]|uniref:BTB domain-containing protein n=1 Tax=Cyclocybe aegerita TaxID=1973307 RepID=A0A8S0WI51_CYCAE|nr:unnamed protein product [Cyclocybe aegerita]
MPMSRDRQEEKRPRKRARVDSDDEDQQQQQRQKANGTPLRAGVNGSASNPNTPKKEPIRHWRVKAEYWDNTPTKEVADLDDVFYLSDPSATVYIRCKDTMFKIHERMFTCTEFFQECLDSHGPTSISNPHRMVAATVDELRAFFWALYATDSQLAEKITEFPHLQRVFRICSMTRKYPDLPRMIEWADAQVRSVAADNVFMDSCSSAALAEFTTFAILHEFPDELALIQKKWCERLQSKSAPSVPAIQVADEYPEDLKELRGIAYYLHIQDMMDRQTQFTESGATHLFADPKLNNGQVMRLLAGYWSLSALWERLRLKPAELPLGASCCDEAHAKCISIWERRWTSAAGWKRILGINTADALALLSCLQDQLSNDDDLKVINPDCRRAGLEEIRKLREKTKDGLGDHFAGVV